MSNLAKYYDALVKDEAASLLWLAFTKTHATGSSLLELAAGTGEITRLLAYSDYHVHASDIDEEILAINQKKNEGLGIEFSITDMRSFSFDTKFDTIVCYCDSVNYLEDEKEVKALFSHVDQHLKDSGVFLFDIHSRERLEEFQEPFIEEGYVDGVAYQWMIETAGNRLYHHFSFWENEIPSEESFYQTVFNIEDIRLYLEELGFSITIFTDFLEKGIKSGERYCIVARREKR